MFQLSGKLDHLLPPRAYYDPQWYREEIDAVFRPNWQFVCLSEEVSKPGSRFAKDILGTPVVVVNQAGKLSALSNVCAHRHSKIVADGVSQGERLRCQIHGWEYDETGRLSHLPDGTSFRGLKIQNRCLESYRIEQLGPFVFVNLTSEGPSFLEHLGTFKEEFQRFYLQHRCISTWVTEHPVNWKIIVENAVESYHVPMVHPETFQDYRAEELHDHRLEPTFTRYGDLLSYEAEKSIESVGFRFYTRVLIRNPTFARFTHVNVFPNLLLYFGDVFSGFTFLEPLGPEKTRYSMISLVPSAIKGGIIGRAIQDLSMILFVWMTKKILREDMNRWPPVQMGVRNSSHDGVLSAREERVYAFQRFIIDQLTIHKGNDLASASIE